MGGIWINSKKWIILRQLSGVQGPYADFRCRSRSNSMNVQSELLIPPHPDNNCEMGNIKGFAVCSKFPFSLFIDLRINAFLIVPVMKPVFPLNAICSNHYS